MQAAFVDWEFGSGYCEVGWSEIWGRFHRVKSDDFWVCLRMARLYGAWCKGKLVKLGGVQWQLV